MHELDSLRQSEILQAAASEYEFVEAEVGVLRTGILLAGEVLLTDTDLLDGVFFLLVGPEKLSALLGTPGQTIRLRVMGRAPTLKETLGQMLAMQGGMLWQTDTVLGWSQGEVESARERWVRAASSGMIQYTHARERPADMVPSRLGDAPRSGPEYEEWIAACRAANRRSGIFTRLNELAQNWPREDALQVRQDFMEWWNRAYLDGEADLHKASWVTFTRESAFPAAQGGVGSRKGLMRLEISGTVLARMTKMPPSMFAEILYQLRGQRELYWRRGRSATLVNLAYGITVLTETSSRYKQLASSWFRIGLAGLAVTTALLGDDFGRGGSAAQVIALALVALTALPYSELLTLFSVRRQRMTGVLSVSTVR